MSYDDTITKGTTSKIIEVMMRDSSTGLGKTALAFGDVTASYCREGGTRVAISLATGTAGAAFSEGKWAEVDATNQKGLYQLHLVDLSLATGVDAVTISLQATGTIDKTVRISLVDVDLRDGVRGGLTALPNAAADSAGGLPISDAGALDLDTILGRITAAVATASALVTAQNDLDLLTGSDGATLATSQPNYAPNKVAPLDAAATRTAVGLASANLDTQLGDIPTVSEFNARTLLASAYFDASTDTVDVGKILGTALTETTAGRIAGNFDTFFENADAATTKVVDDVGVAGSGLTQQQVANAMRLAPTGTVISGSVDDTLSTLATQASVDVIDGIADLILVDTRTTLPATLATLSTNVDGVQTTADAVQVVTDKLDTGLEADGSGGYQGTTLFFDNVAGGGGSGDALLSNQVIMIDHLTDLKGATFVGSTDSNEAIRNRGDVAWGTGGSSGTGLYSQTITVEDASTNALQGARVNVDGTVLTLTTGSDGKVTFNLDAGTYALVVSPPAGYDTPGNTALVVTADNASAATITLTATSTGSTVGWLG